MYFGRSGPDSHGLFPPQLESQCSDLDPEVAAALSMHLQPESLSPEMDFL